MRAYVLQVCSSNAVPEEGKRYRPVMLHCIGRHLCAAACNLGVLATPSHDLQHRCHVV